MDRSSLAEQLVEITAALEAGRVVRLVVNAEYSDGEGVSLWYQPTALETEAAPTDPGEWN